MYDVAIDGQREPVTLEISDALEAADEILRRDYRERIAGFVDASREWLPAARARIVSDVGNDDGLKLMTIYVLFEQDREDSLYGLLFNLDSDRDHARGMMLSGEDFRISKYGDASVAFEG
ncbi:hypothetical protein OK348_10015 [Flavobacterium sp. MXW15]|uniref:Uncharacterized protein n=1 Tax=Xanthomonas chitinilytica TaxID=2989819 RepID=A0ABT3JWU2_9XANT|nr:hypothetical protein [Xanthomonas sp. H13-6]MCW4455135.1 hypothetical protein [Flavobacterium sp. MXW15]MCW4472699.1 hypothetical protein [Xanthomonas sp. H13-6]